MVAVFRLSRDSRALGTAAPDDPRGNSFRCSDLPVTSTHSSVFGTVNSETPQSRQDQNLRKEPNGGLIDILQAGKMDGHLCWEPTVFDRAARWTRSSADRCAITRDNGRICHDRLDLRWQPKLESTLHSGTVSYRSCINVLARNGRAAAFGVFSQLTRLQKRIFALIHLRWQRWLLFF